MKDFETIGLEKSSIPVNEGYFFCLWSDCLYSGSMFENVIYAAALPLSLYSIYLTLPSPELNIHRNIYLS
jgi:hypothetical protein